MMPHFRLPQIDWVKNRIVEFGFAEGEDFNPDNFVKVRF
jgi:hypothetical protein